MLEELSNPTVWEPLCVAFKAPINLITPLPLACTAIPKGLTCE